MIRVRALSCAVLILAAILPGRAMAAPPDPAITSGPASPTAQTSASFTFSESGTGVTVFCDLDGAGFTACDSITEQRYAGPLAAGSYVFSLKAQDTSGAESNVVA